jgi:hypothetical protein
MRSDRRVTAAVSTHKNDGAVIPVAKKVWEIKV